MLRSTVQTLKSQHPLQKNWIVMYKTCFEQKRLFCTRGGADLLDVIPKPLGGRRSNEPALNPPSLVDRVAAIQATRGGQPCPEDVQRQILVTRAVHSSRT